MRQCYFVSDFLTSCLNSSAVVNKARVCRIATDRVTRSHSVGVQTLYPSAKALNPQ